MKPEATPGGRIRAARRAIGMTQGALAEAVGVTRSAVAQWETDRAGQIRANLARIAEVLGVSLAYLVQGVEEPGGDIPVPSRGDEMALLRLYRACGAEDRAILLRTARRLAVLPEE